MKEELSGIGIRTGKTILKYTFKGIKYTGKNIYDHKDEILDVSIGIVKGIGDVCLDVYGATKTDKDFENQVNRIMEQTREFNELSKIKSYRSCDKKMLLESIGISASIFNSYFSCYTIPDEVKMAYDMAYPGLSEKLSLENLVKHTDGEGLRGFVAAIKGKLFEIRYADYLNSAGKLPDGYEAVLAQSATNPGWDIKIVGADGETVKELQLKATESMQYVKHALERYPDIDIVTTEEVYSQLAMHGMAEHVINSGISNDEITSLVETSMTEVPLEMNWGPPVIPLLIIGYSLYKDRQTITSGKLEECGNRYVKSYLSYLIGGALATATSLWYIGLIAAFGSRVLLANGQISYKKYRNLQTVIDNNDKVIKRMREGLT